MKAELCQRHGDMWAIEFTDVSPKDRKDIKSLLSQILWRTSCLDNAVITWLRASHPFLQGDQGNWMLLEFWTGDERIIRHAAIELGRTLGVDIK